ncbi:MAG TPA: FGGY-family carbohydrate kinase, partial [Anaerolineae bacterium]|nr:FGGY-family carbohydrate kinase [Anaerolineae bacterium]
AEQDPRDWQAALFESTQRLLNVARSETGHSAADVAAVSFSGHMNGAVLVDAAGAPLRPAIIWADQRAASQTELIRDRCGEAEVYQLTGNRISPAYTAAKLLWIKEHQPEIYRHTRWVLQAKDYAAFLFSGVIATDFSDASLTLLLDLAGRRWAETLLDQLGLDAAMLPPISPSAQVIGEVTAQAAAATGLRPGTPVVIGGGDGACATVGAGSVRPGDAYNYIGSSSWVALTTAQPVLDPARRTFNLAHLDPALNVALGAMQTAGSAFDWFERLLRCDREADPLYAELDAEAAEVAPGANGLLFLPYLLGERSPHWNPLARGAFVGLAMPNGRGELARAVLEGVAFNLRAILDVLRTQDMTVQAMRLIGGGGKSALWRQILADVYGLPIEQLDLPANATALGAAIAGGIGVGLYPDYSVAHNLAPIARVDYPNPATQARYAALYALFQQSYTALEPIFERLATLPE